MKNVLSILLIPLLLLSNFGIVLSAHLCNGEVVSTSLSIFAEDLNCGTTEDSCADISINNNSVNAKSCCENTIQQYVIEDNYKEPKSINITQKVSFLTYFYISLLSFSTVDDVFKAEYKNYSPPLLSQDVQVLMQSFQI